MVWYVGAARPSYLLEFCNGGYVCSKEVQIGVVGMSGIDSVFREVWYGLRL